MRLRGAWGSVVTAGPCQISGCGVLTTNGVGVGEDNTEIRICDDCIGENTEAEDATCEGVGCTKVAEYCEGCTNDRSHECSFAGCETTAQVCKDHSIEPSDDCSIEGCQMPTRYCIDHRTETNEQPTSAGCWEIFGLDAAYARRLKDLFSGSSWPLQVRCSGTRQVVTIGHRTAWSEIKASCPDDLTLDLEVEAKPFLSALTKAKDLIFELEDGRLVIRKMGGDEIASVSARTRPTVWTPAPVGWEIVDKVAAQAVGEVQKHALKNGWAWGVGPRAVVAIGHDGVIWVRRTDGQILLPVKELVEVRGQVCGEVHRLQFAPDGSLWTGERNAVALTPTRSPKQGDALTWGYFWSENFEPGTIDDPVERPKILDKQIFAKRSPVRKPSVLGGRWTAAMSPDLQITADFRVARPTASEPDDPLAKQVIALDVETP